MLCHPEANEQAREKGDNRESDVHALPQQPQPLSDALFYVEVGAYFDHEYAVVSDVGLAFGHGGMSNLAGCASWRGGRGLVRA